MARLVLPFLMCAASIALAQEGVAAEPPPPPVVETKPAVSTAPEWKPTPPPPTAREVRSGTVGVGYLGLASTMPLVPQGGLGGLAFLSFRTQVPVLGVRWWLRDSRLGLDLGVGVMVTGGTDNTQTLGLGNTLQLIGHVGLPISLVSTQHVIVLIAPELRAGYITLLNDNGLDFTGSLLELAARGAVELFFGFIGVPALSVEAAIRVGFVREAQGLTNFAPLGPGGSMLTTESYRFSTSLAGDAGSVVASTLSLKYYF